MQNNGRPRLPTSYFRPPKNWTLCAVKDWNTLNFLLNQMNTLLQNDYPDIPSRLALAFCCRFTYSKSTQKKINTKHYEFLVGYYLFYDYAAVIEDYRHITFSHSGQLNEMKKTSSWSECWQQRRWYYQHQMKIQIIQCLACLACAPPSGGSGLRTA